MKINRALVGPSLLLPTLLCCAAASAGSVPLGEAANYALLYEGTGGHNLQITNVAIQGSVGVGGTGKVQDSGPSTISASGGSNTGSINFSAANTGQFSNNNASNVIAGGVNYGVSEVTSALNTVNALNTSLAGLGNNIAISGTQSIRACPFLRGRVNFDGGRHPTSSGPIGRCSDKGPPRP